MTQQERKALWDEALELGYVPQRHYREHSVDELRTLVRQFQLRKTLVSAESLPETVDPRDDILQQARYDQLREAEPEEIAGIRRSDGEEVIRIDADKLYAMQELREDLQVILAKAVCKNISKEEVHQLVDEIYSNYADE